MEDTHVRFSALGPQTCPAWGVSGAGVWVVSPPPSSGRIISHSLCLPLSLSVPKISGQVEQEAWEAEQRQWEEFREKGDWEQLQSWRPESVPSPRGAVWAQALSRASQGQPHSAPQSFASP